MAAITFRALGVHGAVGLAIVIVAVLARWASIGDSDDQRLRQSIHAELMNELGGEMSQALAHVGPSDHEGILAVAEHADPARLEVHSMSVSKPILSLGSSEDVVVRVDYSLPGSTMRKYFLFEYSLVTGWHYRGPSTAFSYYANFL